MKKIIGMLVLTLITNLGAELAAQKFLAPFSSISKKKTACLTLQNGEEVEGTIKKLKLAKKGLIKEVHMKVDGKKVKYAVDEIKTAYFPQSALDKLGKIYDFAEDATQWEESPYSADRLKDGYAYYESIDIHLKGDDRQLLMQLLNPFPNNRIKVYHDPGAREEGGMRLGGFKVTKSFPSNYYVSKDNGQARRLREKDYRKRFDDLLGDCRSIKKEYGKKVKWSQFEEAVMTYNENCPAE